MVDPAYVFRRAFSWLPNQFASQSSEPVGPRQFGSTEHPSTEAIAAYVDGELRLGAHLRVGHHMSMCPQCSAEVEAQGQARAALRNSCPIAIPTGLLGALSDIPHRTPQNPPADDVAPPLVGDAQRARRKRR